MKVTTLTDDPLLAIPLHTSSLEMLVALLRALAVISGEQSRLPAELRSYLMQAIDSAADLDIVCDVLADALERAGR